MTTLQQPHGQQTRQHMAQHPLVLILHDTAELDFTNHTALPDAGPIGDGNGRGFLQHNSLTLVPDPKHLLGFAYQQGYIRKEAPKKEHTSRRVWAVFFGTQRRWESWGGNIVAWLSTSARLTLGYQLRDAARKKDVGNR